MEIAKLIAGKQTIKDRLFPLLEQELTFLLAGLVPAMLLANVMPAWYGAIVDNPLVPGMTVSLSFFVNEILMAVFIAVVTKEVAEAVRPGGSLSGLSFGERLPLAVACTRDGIRRQFGKVALPMLATLGGMVGPALLYIGLAMHLAPTALGGWPIATATDIVFALVGAYLIFGRGAVRPAAVGFLLTLAVGDDLGGIVLMAAVFSKGGSLLPLILPVLATLASCLLRRRRCQSPLPYLVLGGVSWMGLYLAHIHPALAMFPIVMWGMPGRESLYSSDDDDFEDAFHEQYTHHAHNNMEHLLKWPFMLTLTLFAFVNAGITLGTATSVTYVVALALLLGKPLGIISFTWIGHRWLRLALPDGVTMRHIVVIGVIAGSGFTVAIFMAVAAFADGPLLSPAKLGALLSLLSLCVAYVVARILGVEKVSETEVVSCEKRQLASSN